jgi:hypothetical protein
MDLSGPYRLQPFLRSAKTSRANVRWSGAITQVKSIIFMIAHQLNPTDLVKE